MLKRRLFLVLHSVWAIPLVVFIRLLRPIVTIRVGTLFSERIGHFVMDSTGHILRKRSENSNTIDLLSFGTISNTQWAKMVKRSIPIYGRWAHYLGEWNRILPGGATHLLPSPFTFSRDLTGSVVQFDAKIPFLDIETSRARNYLQSKGWTPGEPFVCLLVRDDAFLKTLSDPPVDINERRCRDSRIETYLPALQWLAQQGVWILRMGRAMNNPVNVASDRIIDYAFDPERCDLLDIWLFANCTGTITTGSGTDAVSTVYQRPTLFVNTAYVTHFPSFSNCLWVPKHFIWKSDGSPLSLIEQIQVDGSMDSEYSTLGIALLDLNTKEILDAVKEFWGRILGSWIETESDKMLQEKFWSVAIAQPKFSQYNSWKHPDSRMGKAWLEKQDLSNHQM